MARPPGQQYGTAGGQYEQQMGGGNLGQQQFGPPPQAQQGGHPGGQGGQGPERGPAMDIKLEEGLTEEMRVVLHDLVQAATACEWCAERCIDEGPGMAECLRLCRDVADLATLNVQLLARDSVFGPEAIQVFADAAEVCARECARHGHRHCQECAEELSRAVQSTRKMLASFGQGGGGMQGGQMHGGGMQGGPTQAGQMYSGGMQGGQMSPQGGSFQGPEEGQPGTGPFGQPQGGRHAEIPGEQTQLPIEGGAEGRQPGSQGFQQPPDQSFGQPGAQEGQHYSQESQYTQGQPERERSGTRSPQSGEQY